MGPRTIKRQARIAGLLYLLVGLAGPIGLLYVPSQLIVRGDAAATANRIRAGESLLRIGIASNLIGQAGWVFVVLALFRLFKSVNERLAWQMLILGALVSVPIAFANELNSIAALTIAQGPPFLSMFDQAQRDGLCYLFMRLHGEGLNLVGIFWGLWLFPLGLLAIRSGFIPRILGVLVMLAGLGYVADSFTTVLLPRYADAVAGIARILEFGELPIILWLVIWGAKGPLAETPAP